jgi:uncharacterized protein
LADAGRGARQSFHQDFGEVRRVIETNITGMVHLAHKFARRMVARGGVSITCPMPGPTETRFFERAGMLDTKVGQQEKDDPAEVAMAGFDAMMAGQAQVVSGFAKKLQSAAAGVTPAGTLAEQHRKMAEPGTGKES